VRSRYGPPAVYQAVAGSVKRRQAVVRSHKNPSYAISLRDKIMRMAHNSKRGVFCGIYT
jgi:hypothetical protein